MKNENSNKQETANSDLGAVSGSRDSQEDWYDEEYYEGEPNDNCEKCGRTYDDIGYDYQYCKACGWDAENQKWDKPINPTDADYLAGEADILTGRWW